MMRTYYNDNDKFVVQWLHQLMKEGCIPRGEIDTRSIADVAYSDLEQFDQCHFFAGIAGWALALDLAGWGDRPVWTGSCPCQPFSSAGLRAGVNDERHLWPEFRRLIEECHPPVVIGEQVESKDGRLWLSGVRDDLEALDYAFGAADLCAAGVTAPHRRQRLYWVAYTERDTGGTWWPGAEPGGGASPEATRASTESGRCGDFSGMVYAESEQVGFSRRAWQSRSTVECSDGKSRRIEPGIFPLASGFPNRVGVLRGSGNSIVPPLAAEFIKAFLDIEDALS